MTGKQHTGETYKQSTKMEKSNKEEVKLTILREDQPFKTKQEACKKHTLQLLTQIDNQPITWLQLDAFRHVTGQDNLLRSKPSTRLGEERGLKREVREWADWFEMIERRHQIITTHYIQGMENIISECTCGTLAMVYSSRRNTR